jgi:hypothetical protein
MSETLFDDKDVQLGLCKVFSLLNKKVFYEKPLFLDFQLATLIRSISVDGFSQLDLEVVQSTKNMVDLYYSPIPETDVEDDEGGDIIVVKPMKIPSTVAK